MLKLSRALDQRLLDPIFGMLLPEVGDLAGALLGLLLVGAAWKEGAPLKLLARMLLNVALDLGAGSIPLLGDLIDFFFRSNLRNVVILETYLGISQPESSSDRPAFRPLRTFFLLLLPTLAVLAGLYRLYMGG
jgi:hypothetical protein